MQRKNHEMSPQLYLLSIYHPWNKFKTKLLCIFNAAKFVGICWHQKSKETNMSCTWRGLQLAFWPLSPMAASETSQQRIAKIRCIGCIGLGPIGCTWMYIYIQCILAMRHLVARVPLSSCYGINRTRSTMTGSNKQRIYNSWCCMMISRFDPIWSFEISWIRWRFVIST